MAFIRIVVCLCIGIFLAACDSPPPAGGAGPCDFNTGDLRITELGFEGGNRDWIELYNPGTRTLQLNRGYLQIGEQAYIISGNAVILPKQHWVVAAQSGERIDHVLPGLRFPATAFALSLHCESRTATRLEIGVQTPTPPSSGTLMLDRGAYLHADQGGEANSRGHWCAGAATPGQANHTCGLAFCYQGGELQAVRGDARTLLLSEIYSNPPGADQDQEWLEIFNPGDTAQLLNGLMIEQRYAGTADEKIRRWPVASTSCRLLPAGAHMQIRISSTPATDDTLSLPGESLYNGVSTFRLMDTLMDTVVVDEMDVPEGHETYSWVKDPVNNQVCRHRDLNPAFSPGSANPPCQRACLQDGTWHRLPPPAPGQLVLSELMIDPAGTDEGYEWIEFYVPGVEAVALNGITVTRDGGALYSFDALPCLWAESGYTTVATDPDLVNQRFNIAESGRPLANSDYTLQLLAGEQTTPLQTLDIVRHRQGHSWSLDGRYLQGESTQPVYCESRSPWVGSQRQQAATPGSANDPCGDYCRVKTDSTSGSFQWRQILKPQITTGSPELIITEIFRKSSAVPPLLPWLELQNTALSPVDLNGLSIVQTVMNAALMTPPLLFDTTTAAPAGTRFWTVEAADCLEVAPGAWTMLATGPLPPSSHMLDLNFYIQDHTRLHIQTPNHVLDWRSLPAAVSDQAWQYTGTAGCAADTVYDGVNTPTLATPGAANTACP